MEHDVQNKIKEKIINTSTDKIMTKITKSPYIDSIVNKIVTNEHAQFKEKLVQKLMNKLLQKQEQI